MLALLGVLGAASRAGLTGWLIAGIAMGLSILSKGPVVLVHVLPAALLAPWWSMRVRTRFVRWYAGCLFAFPIAATVPAAIDTNGTSFRNRPGR